MSAFGHHEETQRKLEALDAIASELKDTCHKQAQRIAALEQAGTYAEARECEHCNHVGINDAANGIASCTACKWNGDSPKEDKCPDCEAEGTMTASCPKCHHEYRLIADATL
jgi:primosomal protein N'